MSYPLITLPKGVTWGYSKSPKFSTIVQTPPSGRGQVRATLQTSPVWEFELDWNYLKENGVTTANDFQYLQDFYCTMRGGFGAFLFDPSLYNLERLSVVQDITQPSNGFSGQGDGSTKTFQLYRSSTAPGVATFVEAIQNITLMGGIYINGTLASPGSYTQTNFPAQVTFTTAPASGAAISWAGNYNYLVHFADEKIDPQQFMFELWELKSLRLESVYL